MATGFLAHQTMKERDRPALKDCRGGRAALGSRSALSSGSEASLGAQPFPVVSGKTDWVLALFHSKDSANEAGGQRHE